MRRVAFEEKVKFTEKVKRLSKEALTEFVKMVQTMTPKAMRDVGAKKLQIRVDDIDKAMFSKFTEFLDSQSKKDEIKEPPNKVPKLSP